MDRLIGEHGALPPTLTARSGGGGTHSYFRYPEGVTIRSKAGVATGCDVRGDAGYVLAPPSNHLSGGVYEWLTPPDTPIADAPDWLLAMVCESAATGVGVGAGANATADAAGDWVMGSAEPNDLASHPGSPEGERNQTLCRLLGVHVARGDSPRTVAALALAWAARCSPPVPEADVLARVRWAESKRAESDDRGGGLGSGDDASGVRELIPPRTYSDAASGAYANKFANSQSSQVRNAERNGEAVPPTPPPTTLSTLTATGTGPETASASANAQADRGGEGGTPSVDGTGNVSADGFPTLHAGALYGIAGDIVRVIAPETEADPAGVLLTLLTHVGDAVGRGPHFLVGTTRHHANLYACLAGDTASGKGLAESNVEYLMRRADPEWYADCLGHGLSSGEGLIERVRDDDADDTTPFTMPTVQRFLAVETEFVKVMIVARREGNTLSANLRKAWDGEALSTLTRTRSTDKKTVKPLRASNAHISLIGHITPDELRLAMGKNNGVDIANGFANRFLWCVVRRSRLLPHGGNAGVLDAFVEPLKAALEKARAIGTVRRSAEADALWESVYGALTDAKPGAWGLVVGRARAHAVRVAMIYALLDGSDTVNADHLRAALALWRYCEQSARLIFGGGVDSGVGVEPVATDVALLDAIIKNPGITRKRLYEALGNHVKADEMERALASLEARRLAHRRMIAHDGPGRPAEGWFPGTPDAGDDGTGDDGFTMGGDDPPPVEPPCELIAVRTYSDGQGISSQRTYSEGEGISSQMNKFATPVTEVGPPCGSNPTPNPLSTQSPESGADAESGPPEADENVKMTLFAKALAGHGLTVADARRIVEEHREQGRPVPERHPVRWAKEYALAQAKRIAWEQSLKSNPMTNAEIAAWDAEMAAIAAHDYGIDRQVGEPIPFSRG
jgi:hypothetical protein